MLMPRLQYHNIIPYSSKIPPDMKMAATNIQTQQQHHINQLLTTAATGTGVVGDVDALLTPISTANHDTSINTSTRSFDARPERNLWRIEEILQMLEIMQNTNALELLNDKTIKSDKVFRNVEVLMQRAGFRKKTHVQIWTKWKFLKSTYMTSRRNGIIPKMIPQRVYEILCKLLSGNNGGTGSDCGTSNTSMDGDNSNSGRIVISGVEGGYNGKKTADESEEENAFGMAHPIFGFRLGLVKQEPVDIGYETITNNGVTSVKDSSDDMIVNDSCSSTANVHFQTEIKQEVDESFDARTETTAPIAINQLSKRPLRIAQVQTVQTSTPISKPSTPAASPQHAKTPQLPPLRIAPFAKVNNAISIDLPPPPLSMHPNAPRPIRLSSLSNNHLGKVYPKPHIAPAPPNTTTIRLPRDITIHSRASAPANMPRLKQVPMRKTPYSLRPERMIPDLDSAPNSPPSSLQQPYNVYNEGPSTSKHALNSVQHMAPKLWQIPQAGHMQMKKQCKKRRLEVPTWSANYVQTGIKHRRIYTQANTSLGYHGGNESNDEDNDDDAAYKQDRAADADVKFDSTAEQQRESFKAAQEQTNDRPKSFRPSRKEMEFFDSALKDLSISLRQTQREMLTDFFKKQMELASREHEFQMKQDMLIMQAFHEQSQHLMKTARELLGVELKQESDSKEEKKVTSSVLEKNTPDSKPVVATNEEAPMLEEHYDTNDANGNEEEQAEGLHEQQQPQQQNYDYSEFYRNNGGAENGDAEGDEDDDEDDEDDDDDNDDNDSIEEEEEEEEAEEGGAEEEEGGAEEDECDDDENDDDDEDQNEVDDDEEETDPIQLVSSELVEDA